MTESQRNRLGARNGPVRVLDAPTLVAYRVESSVQLPIATASQQRAWIDATNQQFARRCLPMLIANQAGWVISTPHRLSATWNGGDGKDDISIVYDDLNAPAAAISHFGHGVLTFTIPYLFRTPPGWNLLARGPANWPKPGISALEGIVETDWSDSTFTMNWMMTAPGFTVTFEPGEPICMLVPQRRGELESFQPVIKAMDQNPELKQGYFRWSQGRSHFNEQLNVPGSPEAEQKWQKDYFRGNLQSGERVAAHQTKLKLSPFDDPDGFCPPDDEA